MIKGVDTSHWNKPINFMQAKSDPTAPILFMTTKITEGVGGVDVTAPQFIGAAREAGLLVGGYHFFHPSMDGLKQGQFFTSRCPTKLDWYCLDFEAHDNKPADIQLDEAEAFLDYLQNYTKLTPWIYLSSSFMDELGNPSWMSKYNRYLANYNARTSPHFYVPKPWSESDTNLIWQNSENGQCAGLAPGESVDTNLFDGTLDQLKALFLT